MTSDDERAEVRVDLSVARVPPRTYGIDEMAETFVDVDASIVGPAAVEYEFHEATAEGAVVSELFITSTGQRVHFHLTPRMPVTAMSSEVRIVFRSPGSGATIGAVAGFHINADRTLTIPSGETTSVGGFYTGPCPNKLGQILFGTDVFVHIGVYSDAKARRQGSPERGTFRNVAFYTWLDTKVDGKVVAAPAVEVAGGSVEVQHVPGQREARLVYDPRDARGRLVPGRHALTVRWRVQQKRTPSHEAGPADFEDTIYVFVSDDGSIAVGD
jgi:hypothetical protein